MKVFLINCIGEIRKEKKNYFMSSYNYFSLFLWPVMIFFITVFTYSSFQIEGSEVLGISSYHELLIFLITGSLGYNCFWIMVQGAFQIRDERQNGTLEIIYMTPANRLALLYGRALGGFVQNAWLFVGFSSIIILYGRTLNWYTIFLLLVGFVILLFASTIWGGFINALYIASRDASYLFIICDEPMSFFSGVKVPVQVFPGWARVVSSFFPSSYCIYILRSVFLGTKVNIEKIIEFVICLLVIIVLTLIVSCVVEKNNRKTGSLQFY